MALLNIGAGNQDDAFYRYKMPRLVTKIEGRGNGIKTNVVNMVDVAKALARAPAYTTKYFGCELGAQSKFDEKTGTSIVNGAHDTAKLAGLLENFIKKYVQCYGCGNPETEIHITKIQTISLKCAACGFVSDVDMRDKLTTFILKNPPEQKKGGKKDKSLRRAEKERLKAGEAADEEMKKMKKETSKKKGQDDEKKLVKKKSGSEEDISPPASQVDEDESIDGGDDDVQWQTDTSAAAAQQRIKEQLSSATSEMVMLGDENDALSPSAKLGKEKEKKLLRKSSSKKVDAPVVPEEQKSAKVEDLPKIQELSLHDKLVKEFRDCLQKGYTASQLASHVQSKEESQQEVMVAYFEALFEGFSKSVLTKDSGKKKVHNLAKVVQDEVAQVLLLNAIEVFFTSTSPESGKEISLLLKVLYDEDILEEDQILEWFDKKGLDAKSKLARKNSQPFVDWLRSAEAESEEE